MAPDYQEHVRDLQERLEEAEETLRALRSGEVDAIVCEGPRGEQVYTLKGADQAYRVMVQGMAEGALMIGGSGLILFANEQFATLVNKPLEQVMGSRVQDFVAAEDIEIISGLLSRPDNGKAEMRLTADDLLIPVYLSADTLILDNAECVCLIVTDLSEQKRREEIVAAEKLARLILEQAAEAILVVDPEGLISHASRAAERLAGRRVVQQPFDEAFPIQLGAGDHYPFRAILSAVQHYKSINNVEATMTTHFGRKIELLLSAAMLSSPDSGLLGCVLTLTDISERKRGERQLKFQADILESTSEAVVAIDPEQRIMFWNSGAERLYGVRREDAVGHPITDVYQYLWLNPEDEQRAQSAMLQHGIWSGDNIHVRRDGTRIFVSSNVNSISQEYGGGMFAVIRDISESKMAEAILRESEARERSRAAELAGIMEAVPVAVTIARDAECRTMTGNRMAYKLLGIPYSSNISKSAPEDEKPKTWQEMKDGREIPIDELPMQAAASTGKPVHAYEFDLAFQDGSTQCWFGNAVPLFDEAGQSRGAVGAFLDITERKRADARLQQTQKLESIGLLAGGIAHDFNNLLVGVIGNASLALESLPPDSPAVDMLQGVIRTGEQLANLTRQMLAYAGKGRFYVERLNLSDLVPEMSRLIQPSIPKKIAMRFDLERDLPPVEADRGQIQQVFMNLALNAAEAIGTSAGLISVKTSMVAIDETFTQRNPGAEDLDPGVYVCLEVCDTGCGMDPDTKTKVFDPFFSTKFTGRGLGLAAVSGIVRSHKGIIQVTSTPGKGSCFTVMLPAVPGVLPARQEAESGAAANAAGTILVVDDEEVVRQIATKALARHGFKVLAASNGAEAIDIAKRHPGEISLVVLDLSMPGMNGEEVLPELRKVRPGVKVVVSSGYSETETMALFEGQRVCGFIQKPYTSRRIVDKIKSALQ